MNKQEAQAALKTGKKITHTDFFADEYVHMVQGILKDEKGYTMGLDFWRARGGERFDHGWDYWDARDKEEAEALDNANIPFHCTSTPRCISQCDKCGGADIFQTAQPAPHHAAKEIGQIVESLKNKQ